MTLEPDLSFYWPDIPTIWFVIKYNSYFRSVLHITIFLILNCDEHKTCHASKYIEIPTNITVLLLSSIEHEFYPANKYYNANKCWQINIY